MLKANDDVSKKKLEELKQLQIKANNIMEILVKCSLFPSIKYVLEEK